MEMEINRTNDVLFKWIFGKEERKDLLLSFINAVLTNGAEEDVIADIELIDREIDPQAYGDKESRLDILGRTIEGKVVNLEVQTNNEQDMEKRTLYS